MQFIRYHINKLFGLFPPEARVGYGFTVNMLAYLLRAVLNVAFNHQAADKAVEIRIVMDTVQYLFADTDLFHKLLA